MERCLRCEDKCLKEDGSYLKEKINKTIQKFDEKFNEKFNEEINTNPTPPKLKSKKEKKCVFAGESQYDIKEIIRVHNLIFEGKGLKVCFVNGGLGSGKSYKIDKVLEYKNTSNNKVESLMFESFQTGYNDNFIYILFLELVKNERKKPSFKKHWEVFKNNISIGNFILSIPITLSLLIVFYTVIKVFDFTKQDMISTNVGYALLIGITVITSLFILPYALTFRKEYTVLNRDYYYKMVTKLLPEVLIIDDFERLTENQRRQVYEFINYLRANETDENKVETKLNRILILGDLKAVETAELLYKEGTKERITKEAFVTKYYDQRIVLGDWIDTFTEKYNTDYPQLPLNNAETEHITNFLKYLSPILTRREFVMFMNNTEFNYQEKSFEQELVDNLRTTKQFELEENLKNPSDTEIKTGEEIYDDLKLLINRKIPVNRTLYSEGNKLSHNKILKEVVEQYRGLDIDNLDLLLDSLIENNGDEKKQIEFFKIEKLVKEFNVFKDKELNFANDDGLNYVFKDNFADFYEANDHCLPRKYRRGETYQNSTDNEVTMKKQLQILADKYLEDKNVKLNPLEEFSDTSFKYMIKADGADAEDYGYTISEFNTEFKANVDQYISFKENLVFCLIERYGEQFSLEAPMAAWNIVNSNNAQSMYNKLKNNSGLSTTIEFLIEKYSEEDVRSQRIAFLLKYSGSTKKEKYLDGGKYQNESWFIKAEEIIEELKVDFGILLLEFSRKYGFFDLKFLLENELGEISVEEIIEMYLSSETPKEAEVISSLIQKKYFDSLNEMECEKLKNIILSNEIFYRGKKSKELLINIYMKYPELKNNKIFNDKIAF